MEPPVSAVLVALYPHEMDLLIGEEFLKALRPHGVGEPHEMSQGDFLDAEEMHRKQRSTYFDEHDNRVASSRTTPQREETHDHPLGSWRIDRHRGIYGREIEQLRELNPHEVVPSEDTEPYKHEDVNRYAQWMKEGRKHPPVHVVEADNGKMKVSEGHRRWLAAKKAGVKLRAWVSPSVEIPGVYDSEGKLQKTGLTHELAVYYARHHGKQVPDHVMNEVKDKIKEEFPDDPKHDKYAHIRAKYAKGLTATANPGAMAERIEAKYGSTRPKDTFGDSRSEFSGFISPKGRIHGDFDEVHERIAAHAFAAGPGTGGHVDAMGKAGFVRYHAVGPHANIESHTSPTPAQHATIASLANHSARNGGQFYWDHQGSPNYGSGRGYQGYALHTGAPVNKGLAGRATVHAHTSHSKTGKVERVQQYERGYKPAAPKVQTVTTVKPARPKIPAGSPHPLRPDEWKPSETAHREAVKQQDPHKFVPPSSWNLRVRSLGHEPDQGKWTPGLLATYRDQFGKKQPVYSKTERANKDAAKFEKVRGMAKDLPKLRRRWTKDLAGEGLTRDRVAAALMRLVDLTTMRIGEEGNAQKEPGEATFGAASLRKEHVALGRGKVTLSFAGKHHKEWDRTVTDPSVFKVIEALMKLPGDRLWQYQEGKGTLQMTADRVRDYMATMGPYTPKDFRTYQATKMAAESLTDVPVPTDPPKGKKDPAEAVIMQHLKKVADRLGNTPGVCKSSYVNPEVLETWKAGKLKPEFWKALYPEHQSDDEAAFVRLLDYISGLIKRGEIPNLTGGTIEKAGFSLGARREFGTCPGCNTPMQATGCPGCGYTPDMGKAMPRSEAAQDWQMHRTETQYRGGPRHREHLQALTENQQVMDRLLKKHGSETAMPRLARLQYQALSKDSNTHRYHISHLPHPPPDSEEEKWLRGRQAVRKAMREESTGEEEPDWKHEFTDGIDHDTHIRTHEKEWTDLRREFIRAALDKSPGGQDKRAEIIRKMRECSLHRRDHLLHKHGLPQGSRASIRPAMKAVITVRQVGTWVTIG